MTLVGGPTCPASADHTVSRGHKRDDSRHMLSRALNTNISTDLEDSSLIPSGHHPGLVRCCPMIAVITERSDDDVGPPPAR